MPSPRLKLDLSVEAAIFRAATTVLKEDPTLKGVVKTWEVLDGTHSQVKRPDTREMPWIMVVPGPSRMAMVEADRYGVHMDLYVSIATAGLVAEDNLNLFAAVRKALNYRKPFRGTTVAEYLQEAGNDTYEVSSPGFGPLPQPAATGGSPATDYASTARIILHFKVPF